MFMINSMLLWWTLDSTATTRNQAEICKGKSTMEIRAQVQSYVNQTDVTSKLNLKCNYCTPRLLKGKFKVVDFVPIYARK